MHLFAVSFLIRIPSWEFTYPSDWIICLLYKSIFDAFFYKDKRSVHQKIRLCDFFLFMSLILFKI
jgi:hypothetical protein